MKKEKDFVGVFQKTLNDFVNLKRSLGYKYITTRDHLQRFSVFSLSYGLKHDVLDKTLVLDWISKRETETVQAWEHRGSDLRQFALYLNNLGFDAFIPPKKYKVIRPEYIPYIFTHNEISTLFKAVDSIKPHPVSYKHLSIPVLLRLLYCCGLRISEAINLHVCDFDFDNNLLILKKSKFQKDRVVVMTAGLTEIVSQYNRFANSNAEPKDYFFRNHRSNAQFTDRWVYEVYRKLLWKAGISHGGKGKGPRLHDLRHTFCVHSLEQQVKAGKDMYVALPILSTYIGHSSTAATQRYVRLTPEAFPDLLNKVKNRCSNVIPEIKPI